VAKETAEVQNHFQLHHGDGPSLSMDIKPIFNLKVMEPVFDNIYEFPVAIATRKIPLRQLMVSSIVSIQT
jgi:hypothetical protein